MSLLPSAKGINWLILALGPEKVELKLFKCQTAIVYYDPSLVRWLMTNRTKIS